ncbi:hypothetical protein [Curtobacterium phage Penoan]|nr:hypothetical protein [Curtobacterium phage Penoan]
MVWDHVHNVTAGERLVLLAIADQDGDGGAFPSVDRLARRCGMDPRSVRRAVAHLEELGHVRRLLQQGAQADQRRRTNRYTLTVECPDNCVVTRGKHELICTACGSVLGREEWVAGERKHRDCAASTSNLGNSPEHGGTDESGEDRPVPPREDRPVRGGRTDGSSKPSYEPSTNPTTEDEREKPTLVTAREDQPRHAYDPMAGRARTFTPRVGSVQDRCPGRSGTLTHDYNESRYCNYCGTRED